MTRAADAGDAADRGRTLLEVFEELWLAARGAADRCDGRRDDAETRR